MGYKSFDGFVDVAVQKIVSRDGGMDALKRIDLRIALKRLSCNAYLQAVQDFCTETDGKQVIGRFAVPVSEIRDLMLDQLGSDVSRSCSLRAEIEKEAGNVPVQPGQ